MPNRYLMDRAMRRSGMRDGRNPYGSRGGYVSSSRRSMRGRDRADMNYDMARGGNRDYRGYDRGMDMGYDYAKYGSGYGSGYNSQRGNQDGHYPYERYGERNRPMDFEMYGYGVGGIRPMNDYGMYPYPDYAHEDMEKEYKKDLHTWVEKLKKKDRFGLTKDVVLQKAREMGVKFDEIDEMEYYAIYLAMVSDHPQISNDPHLYLAMAKDFIFDDDVAVSPSEKVCIYLYQIVLGEE